MNIDSTRLVIGMEVVSPAGEAIGRVKDVRTNDFLVDIAMHRDLYVPLSAVRELGGHTVVLGIARAEIDEQSWEVAPLLGGPQESDSTAERSDVVVGSGDPAERGSWSASSDSYSLEPLDTRPGRNATSGTDDGEPPRPGQLSASGDSADAAQLWATADPETERLRDMFG